MLFSRVAQRAENGHRRYRLNHHDSVQNQIGKGEGSTQAGTCAGGASLCAQAPLLFGGLLPLEPSTTARVRFFGASGLRPLRRPMAVPIRGAGIAVTAYRANSGPSREGSMSRSLCFLSSGVARFTITQIAAPNSFR